MDPNESRPRSYSFVSQVEQLSKFPSCKHLNDSLSLLLNIYLFKFNNRNTRKSCEICLKLKVEKPHWRRSGVFIVNFEHILHLFVVFLLLNLGK